MPGFGSPVIGVVKRDTVSKAPIFLVNFGIIQWLRAMSNFNFKKNMEEAVGLEPTRHLCLTGFQNRTLIQPDRFQKWRKAEDLNPKPFDSNRLATGAQTYWVYFPRRIAEDLNPKPLDSNRFPGGASTLPVYYPFWR